MQFANFAVGVKPQLPDCTTVGAGLVFTNWSVASTLRTKRRSPILQFGCNPLATPAAEELVHVLFLVEAYLNLVVACRT